jgi:GGDEF domain-containing protein
MFDMTILRLIISQILVVVLLFVLVPIKKPIKRNFIIIVLGTIIILGINALLIRFLGIIFYIRFYYLTLTLPYIIFGLFFTVYSPPKFIFAVLTSQVIANLAVVNGLLTSYLVFGENTPWIDLIARVVTYIIFIPIVDKSIRPTFTMMAREIKRGWWLLNSTLILSYALTYFVLFVPNDIFKRPQYFVHAYIVLDLSLLIYAIIFLLFVEIKRKISVEQEKMTLSQKVSTLAEQSAKLDMIAYRDALTGVKNRYLLLADMNQLIEQNKSFLIVFLDLNNLKKINDNHGHAVGDKYLTQFASALQSALDLRGVAYRYGGDEFGCLINNESDSFDTSEFSKEVEDKMKSELTFLGFGIGFARYSQK